MPMGAGFCKKARTDSETWDLGLAMNEGKLEELSPPAPYVVVWDEAVVEKLYNASDHRNDRETSLICSRTYWWRIHLRKDACRFRGGAVTVDEEFDLCATPWEGVRTPNGEGRRIPRALRLRWNAVAYGSLVSPQLRFFSLFAKVEICEDWLTNWGIRLLEGWDFSSRCSKQCIARTLWSVPYHPICPLQIGSLGL